MHTGIERGRGGKERESVSLNAVALHEEYMYIYASLIARVNCTEYTRMQVMYIYAIYLNSE